MHLHLGGNGTPETIYVRQSRDYVKEDKELPRDPKRVLTESRVLNYIDGIVPGVVPRVISLDLDNNILVLSDIKLGGHLLADELVAGRIHESVGHNFGRTIGLIQNKTFGLSFSQILGDDSFKESDDKNAYLGLRVDVSERIYPSQTAQLLADSKLASRCLVIGDLSPKNIFVEGNDARFLDLERTSMGDPAYDPAYIICHFLIDVNLQLHDKSVKFIQNFMQAYVNTISESLSYDEMGKLKNRIIRFIGMSILHRTQGTNFVTYSGGDKDMWQQKAGILMDDLESISVTDAIRNIL
jgi:5-methylthioribose kinase